MYFCYYEFAESGEIYTECGAAFNAKDALDDLLHKLEIWNITTV